ncbi:MAG: hypothetical protein LBG43_04655 [Treponema sp.]|nr:hypothetical protein [Treponema sp.]
MTLIMSLAIGTQSIGKLAIDAITGKFSVKSAVFYCGIATAAAFLLVVYIFVLRKRIALKNINKIIKDGFLKCLAYSFLGVLYMGIPLLFFFLPITASLLEIYKTDLVIKFCIFYLLYGFAFGIILYFYRNNKISSYLSEAIHTRMPDKYKRFLSLLGIEK